MQEEYLRESKKTSVRKCTGNSWPAWAQLIRNVWNETGDLPRGDSIEGLEEEEEVVRVWKNPSLESILVTLSCLDSPGALEQHGNTNTRHIKGQVQQQKVYLCLNSWPSQLSRFHFLVQYNKKIPFFLFLFSTGTLHPV